MMIFSDDLTEVASLLRNDAKAHVFVVAVGGAVTDIASQGLVGTGNSHRIIRLNQWLHADSEQLGPIVDDLCKVGCASQSQAEIASKPQTF
jgi:hypothetical protein